MHKKGKANKKKESCEKSNERSKQREEKGELEGMRNEKKRDAHAKGELSEIEVKQERKSKFLCKRKRCEESFTLEAVYPCTCLQGILFKL